MSLLLKQISEEKERAYVFSLRTDPEIGKTLTGNPPKTYEDHLRYLGGLKDRKREIFVAYFDKEMVGYSQVYFITDISLEVGFVVDPKHQGKGLGKKLVQETIHLCKSHKFIKKIVLYVKEDNSIAVAIYEKFKFIKKNIKDGLIYMELTVS